MTMNDYDMLHDCLRTPDSDFQPTRIAAAYAQKIRRTRKEQDMTLRAASEAVGVDIVTYSAWECAAAPLPEGKVWERIVEVLGL
jgi:DNA-binding XRE family transcriptional regulator